MTNSSATGGYLPQQNVSLSDNAVVDVLQEALVGIVGLTPSLIRPRWQPNPPRAPEVSVDWAALGITLRESIDYPVVQHHNGGPDRLTRWSTVTVLCSFYGPNAQGNAEMLRDGLYIGQNLEALGTDNIKLHDAGSVTAMPELVNTQWYNRADIPVRFSVSTSRDYNILDIASADGTITADDGVSAGFNVIE